MRARMYLDQCDHHSNHRLDLPPPEQMGRRWSLHAAVLAARGPRWSDSTHARVPGTWHYDDGSGNWADLRLVTGKRAVLIGHDHEYSDTYFGAAAEYFGEKETDLLADTPSWWSQAIADYLTGSEQENIWIGFVYGFDGKNWSRASYSADDGFTALDPPFLADDNLVDTVARQLAGYADDHMLLARADHSDIVHALDECPALTIPTAERLLSGRTGDAGIAVEAARAFIDT
ncbi:hypothetical protein ABH922_004559 [Rhodococcus sp. 27YEA15]|uniref:hypothetical protein n=1 Tax=Rhodococcus sp. 27YEA15 TaxID=3156259 RepID=UPI003C7BB23B